MFVEIDVLHDHFIGFLGPVQKNYLEKSQNIDSKPSVYVLGTRTHFRLGTEFFPEVPARRTPMVLRSSKLRFETRNCHY